MESAVGIGHRRRGIGSHPQGPGFVVGRAEAISILAGYLNISGVVPRQLIGQSDDRILPPGSADAVT
jgi:hypothetical protein